MLGAVWNIGRLVFMHDLYVGADCHSRSTAYDDPVLGAVVMQLQRQPSPWLDDDTLNLEPTAPIDRLIGAPWAVNL
jgi:hypothetical protein